MPKRSNLSVARVPLHTRAPAHPLLHEKVWFWIRQGPTSPIISSVAEHKGFEIGKGDQQTHSARSATAAVSATLGCGGGGGSSGILARITTGRGPIYKIGYLRVWAGIAGSFPPAFYHRRRTGQDLLGWREIEIKASVFHRNQTQNIELESRFTLHYWKGF